MKKNWILLGLVIPAMAFAHIAHGPSSFMSGFLHPISGLDHVLTMLAVGLWAASFKGAGRWFVPVIFVTIMIIGFTLGLKRSLSS